MARIFSFTRHSAQAEEDAAMLKYFNRIAREMLFLHGHLTRPTDWAQNEAADRTPRGRKVEATAPKRPRPRRLATIAAACCEVVTPNRLIVAQFR
jgi:hypothetical protein